MNPIKWIMCPVCGGKTRVKMLETTQLYRFPLYCPKCRHETLVNANYNEITMIKEPDAKTQSYPLTSV